VILGPAAEQQMRRSLQLSDGSLTGLVNSPMAVVVYVIVLLIVFFPLIKRFLPKPTPPAAPTPEREKVDA
jgi:putative tricarboxylic transport membrane protein